MDENSPSFWEKKPDELNVSDQLKLVALIPAAMVVGFMAPAIVLGAVDKIRTRFKRKPQVELAIVETTTDEVS